MEGFGKIDFGVEKTANDTSGDNNEQEETPNTKKKLSPILIVLLIAAALAIFGFFAILLPARPIIVSAQQTYSQAKLTLDAVKKQNITLASDELDKTKKDLIVTSQKLNSISFVRFIPVVNWYYNDAYHILKAASYGVDGARVLIDSVKPYSDVLGLKGQGSFVGGTASQRIETAVRTMGTITPHIDEIASALELAQKEIDMVDPNHYPAIFGGGKIKQQLTSIKSTTDQAVGFVSEARPLVKILPNLLGEPTDKKYLILFQNDGELRPTGGFITAYAVFRLSRGVIHVDRSDDIYTLDSGAPKPKAPAPILKYLANVTTFNLRDTNLSPDFIESMNTFNSIYEKTSGRVSVDGIIAIDTHVLVSVLKILDDEIVVDGIRFTTKNDARCNCPQVIYQLESLISTPRSLDLRITSLATAQAVRKDILGSLLYALMDKALKSSPKLYWGPLFQNLLTQANQKHVLFYLYNKDAQAGIDALNVAGRIKSVDGDYLHINEANFGGAKANLFVQESVDQKIDISGTGVITKTVTINYKNPHPPSDCNLERGGLCLNAVLRDWIRVYVPKGSQLVDNQGSEVKVTSYEELGKTVFEGFLTVRPLGTATYKLKYTLPFKLANGSPLPLFIQKQPGTDKNEYTINMSGKQVEKFNLLSDKKINLKL